MRSVLALCLIASSAVFAQEKPVINTMPDKQPALVERASVKNSITLPAGTKVPVALKNAISTKNAREGDPVYAVTNFPVVVNDRIAVPPGTYVQGVISKVQRAGRVKGKSEILVHFNSLIFPSGYTVMLPGAVNNVPGAESSKMKGQEGTIQGSGGKGKDAGTIATDAGIGTAIGSMGSGGTGKGAAIGAASGGIAGLATVLLTRGPDVRLESGQTVEMILERDIVIDRERARQRD